MFLNKKNVSNFFFKSVQIYMEDAESAKTNEKSFFLLGAIASGCAPQTLVTTRRNEGTLLFTHRNKGKLLFKKKSFFSKKVYRNKGTLLLGAIHNFRVYASNPRNHQG